MDLEDDEDYPLWLGDSIIQDKLPWQQGLNVNCHNTVLSGWTKLIS